MDVCSTTMGPERVLPNSEDELEEELPVAGAMLPGNGWAGAENGAELEEEEEDDEGYYYQPLNQDPEGVANEQEEEAGPRGLQQQIQAMGLHLPEAPPPDSDEEEDPEGAAAQRSRASIPMDAEHVELVKRTMAAVALPSLGVPPWAQQISEDQWKDMVQQTLQNRQSAGGLRPAQRSGSP